MTSMKKVLQPHTLYLGDNGRCYCGEHSGMSARYTGRDISGQPVEPITPAVLAEFRAMDFEPECEDCGRKASALFLYGSGSADPYPTERGSRERRR